MLCSPVQYEIENITAYMLDMKSSQCRSAPTPSTFKPEFLFTSKVQRVPLPEWGVGQIWTSSISDDNETICGTEFCDWDNSNKGLHYHCTGFGFVLVYLIPLILVTGMHFDIAKRIAPPDLLKCKHCIDEQTKASRNVFNMLVSITVCFFVFWLPFHMQRLLSLILKYHGGEENPSIKTAHYIFHSISGCCFYLNCAANPFLFNMFSDSFRKASVSTGKRLVKKIQSIW
ncbi:unnamed protein product [Cylicocyclus nassatus]|uniref:G-protein coupled receptors family 1 profile domain-containing protein n=1 Tax=Cylicocyclus nassatus TaxID=53992 RepID=A0AA36HB27_CYLNA|nr:unnamed protein product [Cylicocyclus nassatus]